MRRIALVALLGAAAAGAIAARAAHAENPGDRLGAAVALLWTALPLVLAARVCLAAQDRGWAPPWRAGVVTATLALVVASLVRAALAGFGRGVADPPIAHSVSTWSVLLAAGGAALALAVGAAGSAWRRSRGTPREGSGSG
jgi:hypothetical protein